MLQKLNSVAVRGAVLLLLTAALFVQKPNLGLALNRAQIASNTITDPSSAELFPPEPEVSELTEETSKPAATQAPRVASQEVKKPQVFIDTINNTLPPVVEANAESAYIDTVGLIRKYASEYGANAEVMIAIARCESGFNADATSPSGAYKGIYQFVTSTWQSNRREMGLSDDPALMYNPEEAIKTAAFKMARDGYGAWPVCSQKAFASLALN